MRVTWTRAAAWRAGRHHLDRRAPAGSMLAVASRLCGLHAQVLSSAELSVWARVEGLDRGAVQRAVWEDRTLVKTWAMRGTLHLLPASELPLWHAALGTSRRYRRPATWRRFGLTLEELDRLTEAVAAALDGRMLTREELAVEVERLTGSAALGAKIGQSSWGMTLKPAAFAGHLCFAPSLGQRVRFTRPDAWLAGHAGRRPARASGRPGPRRPPGGHDPHAAMAGITRRFLAAYGPATHHDLARWWGGGGAAAARQWIASLGDEAAAVEVDGVPAWMLAADLRDLRELPPPRAVRLLPAFDHYVVAASRHAERLLAGAPRARVYRAQGWISPVLLVDGRMAGTWRHEVKGARVMVVVEPFAALPARVRRLAEEEAERLAAFLGHTLDLSWKT